MRASFVLAGCALAAGLPACEPNDGLIVAALDAPMGLAVAGHDPERLFVSNLAHDTVQVLNLEQRLDRAAFVLGPALHVPLRIPAGRGPAALATVGEGRFVAVLDVLSESVRLIDADSLTLVRDGAGEVLQLPLGVGGARPTAMVAAAGTCAAPCVGELWLSLAGAGALLGVEVREQGGAVSLAATRAFVVGGAPGHLAVDPTGRSLFATDSAGTDLTRVDLASGTTERRALGGAGGALAVSQDGTLVVVARPAFRDLVVFGDADGAGLVPLDANPFLTPAPKCVRRCDDPDPTTCSDAHPADRALCADDDGLAAAGAYGALYVGDVPARIVTLGAAAQHPPLVEVCGDASDEALQSTRDWAELAAVTLLNGEVVFVGLRQTATSAAQPTLVRRTWCVTPTLVSRKDADLDDDVDPVDAPLADLLQPCPALPEGRNRLACVTSDGGAAGVVITPGNTGTTTWRIAWEGILAGLDRTAGSGTPGAGQILEDGSFTDRGIDLGAADIRPCRTAVDGERCSAATPPASIVHWGDLLEIVSAPLPLCQVTPCAGATSRDGRLFTRRIVGVEPVADGQSRLVLDRPYSAEERGCFRDGGVIEYRIRAGDQFTAQVGSALERLSPGQRLGPGGDAGRNRAELFALRSFPTRPELDDCARYAPRGGPLLLDAANPELGTVLDPVLDRRAVYYLGIDDPYQVFRSAKGFDDRGAPAGSAGTLPGAMIVSEVGAPEPVIFISYTGSNTVLGMVPFSILSPWNDPRRYTIYR